MLRLAVVGKDVSASLSPKMHRFILGGLGETCTYEKVSVPPCDFASRAEELFSRFDAFNVTIPFKTDILPHLRSVEGDAALFGAVNTVVSATRTGYNTDGYGFLLMLQSAGLAVCGRRVLVLGAGGAGRSCIRKLLQAGAKVFAYERDPLRLGAVYGEFGGFVPLAEIPDEPFDLIVNCTGVGMHQSVGTTPEVRQAGGRFGPVGMDLLSRCGAAVDLIYEPEQSQFLSIAAALGKRTVNGEQMLFFQAYRADCIFLRREADAQEAQALFRAYRSQKSTEIN